MLIPVFLCYSLVGIGEVLLLPLDVLKIIKQTNPESVQGRSVMSIFIGEGRNLSRQVSGRRCLLIPELANSL
jgi:hypothetical protein